MSYEKDTIMTCLRRIHEGELVLPAIQRDFVWDEEHIYNLMDSILRGYPFGTLLFWNTKQRVQYREFIKEWSVGQHYTYSIKERGKKCTLVLDGQQRLQSLYCAIFGAVNNRELYFNILSGNEPEDVSQARYIFLFLSANQAEEENANNAGKVYFIKIREVANIERFGDLAARIQYYHSKLQLSADASDGRRISDNLSYAYAALKSDPVMNYYIIDKEYGDNGVSTSLDEILEIFVRVNSGGEILTKSDLMFSLMQLNWEEAGESVTRLVDELNNKGHFQFDKDFVLKCALVCIGEGAKYEVNKFRKEDTIKNIQSCFPAIQSALLNCVDFILNTSKILDGRVLRSYNTLIIFVYFLYLQRKQEILGEDIKMHMNEALYLSLMSATFSRFADSYIDMVVKNILIPENTDNPGKFPLQIIRGFIEQHKGVSHFNDELLQRNIPLLMNILENGRILPDGKQARVPEYDHIFPKAKLREMGFNENSINDFANFRLVPAIDNNWKRDQDPKQYFNENPKAMNHYLIPGEYWDYSQYPDFLEARRKLIWIQFNKFFGYDGNGPIYKPIPNSENKPHVIQPPEVESLSITEEELILKVLQRAPISDGQGAVYQALYDAGDDGLTIAGLAQATGKKNPSLVSTLGALGYRIEYTPGIKQSKLRGINLLFTISNESGVWYYWLRPIFRKILEENKFVSMHGEE